MKRTFLTLAIALPLALGAAACGSSVEVPAQTASAATRAPLQTQLRGPLALFGEAVAEVPLRPEQRATIEKLAEAAKTRHESLAPARKDVALALADQVDKGALDEAALAPKVDAAVAQWTKVQAEDRKALEEVHRILDAEQRVAFANAIDAKMSEHRAPWMKHTGKHGPPADKAGAPPAGPAADEGGDERAERRHHGAPGEGGDFLPMHKLSKELDLTPQQKATLFELMRADWKDHDRTEMVSKMAEMHERHEKLVAAFRTDHFVMDEVAPVGDAEKQAREMLSRGGRFAKVALPVLTEDQRHTAAKLIRDRATDDRAKDERATAPAR